MERSRLEMYVDILKVLSNEGPLKMTHLMYKANVDCGVLHEYLDFLIKQGFAEERIISEDRVFFLVTERGVAVLKFFNVFTDARTIDEQSPKTI
jgi:predicted transcriptional regulator